MGSAQLQTGRLGNQFASLTSQLTGLHPIVGNIASVLGNFAIGGAVTVGVLGGLTLITVAWDKLTESSRKAREEGDKVTKALIAQARAAREATVAGAENLQLIEEVKLQAAKEASGVGVRSVIGTLLTGKPGLDPTDASASAKRIADAQTGVEQAILRVKTAHENANKPLQESVTKTVKLRDTFNEVRDAAEEYQLQQQIAALKLGMVLEELQKIAALHAEIAGYTKFTGMPNISMPFEGLNDKQKKELIALGVLKDDANKNAHMLQSAIYQSAHIVSNAVMSALNVGGGGKGSQIGGQLGAIAGGVGGSMLGPAGAWFGGAVGSAVGSVVGGVLGSAIGGLFDNKKEVSANTQALRANTAALLLNAPSVYKVAQGRFDATEVKEFRRGLQRYATRGGAPVMVTP